MTGTLLVLSMLALQAPVQAAPQTGMDAELTSQPYLSEVTRHLYRWHLDENDVKPELNRGEFVYWVRELHPTLDSGDESSFAEIVLPRVGVMVQVKQADYEIPELHLEVHNDGHKIMSVARFAPKDAAVPEGFREVRLDYAAMRDHLFQTRSQLVPPGGELLTQMRMAAGAQTQRYLARREIPFPTEPQTLHLAPISPVANEAWVFWEEGRLLYRFHADVDLDDPAVWDHPDLTVELFDLDDQVVVSLDEVPGSNAYVTRDMVGRVLYNCVVLGRREVITPGDVTANVDD